MYNFRIIIIIYFICNLHCNDKNIILHAYILSFLLIIELNLN